MVVRRGWVIHETSSRPTCIGGDITTMTLLRAPNALTTEFSKYPYVVENIIRFFLHYLTLPVLCSLTSTEL
jgi:hypothetical protein